MDVWKPLLDKLWIGTSKEYGWSISLEYEGNHAYCIKCGLLGHSIGLCRKKRQDQGKAIDDNTRHNNQHIRSTKWVEKRKEDTTQPLFENENHNRNPIDPVTILKGPAHQGLQTNYAKSVWYPIMTTLVLREILWRNATRVHIDNFRWSK